MNFSKLIKDIVYICYILCVSMFLYASGRSLRRQRTLCHHSKSKSRIDIDGDGVKIEPISASKVYIDSFSEPFDDGHSLRFEFKTHSANAPLFYINRRNDEHDMVSGGIQDGFLQLKIRCKLSHADLTVPLKRVDDGDWHKVKFQRKSKKVVFLLDDIEFFEQHYIGCGGFTSLNFGNINTDEESAFTSEIKKQNEPAYLNGCIRHVHISTGIEAPPHYVAVSECN